MAVALSYSLPAFTRDGWDRSEQWLRELRDLGFRSITLHPTFRVTDANELFIRADEVPDPLRVVLLARELGLQIRVEPHLDWEHIFTGRYEWRRRMYLDPSGQYFTEVLEPLAALLPDELTLGSELDVSCYEFAASWRAVADRLRPLGIAIGHKLNHDWKSARAVIRNEANLERARRGLEPRGRFGYGGELRRYLGELDYVAVSFYQPEPWQLDPQYVVGEFGLGSTDESRPWYFDEDRRFRSEADFAARRHWYLRFLSWLAQRDGRAASFWTVGQFDVLGLFDPVWRDEEIVGAVRAYNQASP